jgi:pimeloyl-ACP methyl ester carboxylesterase
MEVKEINWQGAIIKYKVTGRGETVVLVHGFGEDSTVWQPQIDFLKQSFRLIVPDLPGSGQSRFVPDANIETYAEILKVILDTEQVAASAGAKVSLIGHSMGGYVTLAFAEKYPQYLNSFGLFHSSAFADNEEKKETRKKAIEFIRSKGGFAFLKTSIPGLFTKEFSSKDPARVEALVEASKNFSDEALIQYYEGMIERPDRTDVLKNFERPILFLIGEHDTAIPLQASLEQCHIPAQSHVHILSSSAHMGMWEQTEKANKLLLEFLCETFKLV